MLERLRARATFANVTSTIALVTAVTVGGSLAIGAIQGNGSVKSGAKKGFDNTYDTVLNIPGIAKVQGTCDAEIIARVKNNSGGQLYVNAAEIGGGGDFATLQDGESEIVLVSSGAQSAHVHLFRTSGADTPAADITISVGYHNETCADTVISAEALATG